MGHFAWELSGAVWFSHLPSQWKTIRTILSVMDFTIFGNPLPDWSEPGVVWVMKDENENGEADDTWYQLAGSDYFFSTTLLDYQVSYANPGGLRPWMLAGRISWGTRD